MAVFSVTDSQHGDFTHEWNPHDPASVANARKMFDDLKSKGFLMFHTGPDGQSVHVRDFDAALAKILYVEHDCATEVNKRKSPLQKVGDTISQMVAPKRQNEIGALSPRAGG